MSAVMCVHTICMYVFPTFPGCKQEFPIDRVYVSEADYVCFESRL